MEDGKLLCPPNLIQNDATETRSEMLHDDSSYTPSQKIKRRDRNPTNSFLTSTTASQAFKLRRTKNGIKD